MTKVMCLNIFPSSCFSFAFHHFLY